MKVKCIAAILTLILVESCVNFKNARYFEPIDSKELTYMPMNERAYSMHPKFTYLEKNIFDTDSTKIGEFIVEAYANSNEQYLCYGVIIPFLPTLFPNKYRFGEFEVLRLGLDFYDTCRIYNNLNEKSFLLEINNEEKRTLQCSAIYKSKKDCGLKNRKKTMPVKCSITYFFRSKSSIGHVSSLKLIPIDDEGKQVIGTTKFKKKRKFYFEYIFGPHGS